MKKYKNVMILLSIYIVYFGIVELTERKTRCFIKNITGVPCPGCGLSRAYSAFFKGDFAKAFFYHPLFLVVPMVISLAILNVIVRNEGLKKISNGIYIVVLLLAIVLYIFRMVHYFPDHEPMNFYSDGIYPWIIKNLRN